MEGIRKFKVNTGGLSQGEKVLFDKLIRAAESIAPLYLKQKNPKYPGANFYPHKVSREEIKKAAKKNPAVLDPYTFVEQDKFGELVAVPFHIKFHRELTKISNLLKEAANLSPDRNLKLYLQSRAEALLTDNYDESNILYHPGILFPIDFLNESFSFFEIQVLFTNISFDIHLPPPKL